MTIARTSCTIEAVTDQPQSASNANSGGELFRLISYGIHLHKNVLDASNQEWRTEKNRGSEQTAGELVMYRKQAASGER